MPFEGATPSLPEALFLHGDSAVRLRELPDGIAHCAVTSPPYFGLRNYGETGQIGMESSPREYAARLVAVLHELRRVLRDDGSLWLVIDDSYASSSKGTGGTGNSTLMLHNKNEAQRIANADRSNAAAKFITKKFNLVDGVKQKDLLGIPWMIALALRDDGWYLREEIIWSKSSCMPESVRDRCTRQHETVFHLTKSPTYYHDWFAIAEKASGTNSHDLTGQGYKAPGQSAHSGSCGALGYSVRNARSVWEINPEPYEAQLCCACGTYWTGRDYRRLPKDDDNHKLCTCGSATSWLSHFAVFPTRLVSRCLRASLSAGGCCSRCGAPSRRIITEGEPDEVWQAASGADKSGGYIGTSRDGASTAGAQDASATKARILAGMRRKETAGWKPICGCNAPLTQRPLVIDPFSGAGTTALVTSKIGADSIGIDLNRDYIRMAEARLRDVSAKCLDTSGARL